MVNRIVIHIKNLIISMKWIFNSYFIFKKHLEQKGYYTLSIYKIWLWKKDARYFRVYNMSGECFFIKMKAEKNIIFEFKVLDYIHNNNFDKIKFYPQIIESNTIDFFYNIYKNIDGKKIKKSSFSTELIDQMIFILIFFEKHNIVHRDIRPHNIVLINKTLMLLDFEHCVINNQSIQNSIYLNKKYRFSEKIWDDAFSFKKIVNQYCKNKKIINSKSYKQINSMIGKLRYESAF